MKNMLAIASEKHKNQFDKGGMPYILHPLKVMHYLRTDDLELMAIAVLHDVVEDCDVTYDELRDIGMSERVITGVKGMTKVPGESFNDMLYRLTCNKDVVKVKMADLRHNMDIRRLKGVSDKDTARLAKYSKIYTIMKGLI